MFNWAIIAPGRIAQRFAKGLEAVEKANLYAVGSSNLERANEFAEKFNADRTFDSYADLANDPNVDAIYIANPHRFHFETALLCLQAGKPVLCEKPLTVNKKQAQTLIDTAKENNVFLMEALWSRFLPVWVQVKNWLAEGRIGEVKILSSMFGFNIPRDQADRLLNPELAGGVLLDMGVYNCSMSQFVMGSNPVSYTIEGYVGETGVDERVSATLNYGNNRISQFTCNFQADTNNEFVIYGTKGKIVVHQHFWDTTQASLYVEDKLVETFNQPFLASGFEYQIMEVMKCLEAGKIESDIISWSDTLTTMELMDSMLDDLGVKYPFIENS